jgi:Mrp family chromosome partitioning ATPase
MSRMFSVISGGTQASARPVGPGDRSDSGTSVPRVVHSAATATAEAIPNEADTGFVIESEQNPFVEVGGPNGAVFSIGAAPRSDAETQKESLAVFAAPEIPAPSERLYPRLAKPLYLSVTFHDLNGTPRKHTITDGPDPGLVAFHLPDHPVSGEYRILRDEIRLQLPEPSPRVLMFAAAMPEAGTTTVLLNLAITLARENAPRVLVLDTNLSLVDASPESRGSDLAEKLAQAAGPGLAEVLSQQVPLAWAARPSAIPNLHVLAAGAPTAGVTAVIGEDLPKLVEQLRQWYDWVLIDAGVWGTLPERDAICPSADAVYVVSRLADVERSEFVGLRGWVKQLGGLLRGYITTRV